MSVDLFIPEVWAAQLLTTLKKRLVFGQPSVSNRDYEGDISAFGDTVHIGTLTDPTIADYTRGSTTISPETLATTDQTLLINQAKYFAFEVDDVDARQVRDEGNLLTAASERSAFGLADAADQYIAGLITAGAGDTLAAGSVATANDAYTLIREMMVAQDKANVPSQGRYLVVSPDFYAVLLSDNRFINAMAYGSSEPVQNGLVGSILGYSVLKSNNIPEGTAGTAPAVSNFVIAGHPMGCTYAEQINKVEAYRPQDSFADAIKGLHLYGAKVVRPEVFVVQDTDVTVSSSN